MKYRYYMFGLFMIVTDMIFGQNDKLKIYTDERIELLNTIQYLSGYPILNQSDSLIYRKYIEEYFESFKNHSAVALNKFVYRKFLGFDRAVNFILHYRLPDFELITPFTNDELVALNASLSQDTLNLLASQFKKFYFDTKFNNFYKSHLSFYLSLHEPIINEIKKHNIISTLENHYRTQHHSYNILISPMLHDGGYGANILEEGKDIYYAIIGPIYDSLNKIPVFDTKNIISEYILHEMSHNFCNPIIDSNWNELSKLSCLFDSIETSMKEQAYNSWKTCLYEHLVRANEVILNGILFGEEKSQELRLDYINDGNWLYLDDFISIINDDYLKDKLFKTQYEVMPFIIEKLIERTKYCN